MKQIKKLIKIGAVAGTVATMTVTSAVAEKIDMASVFSTAGLFGEMGKVFAKNVSLATGGDVKLKIYEPGDLVPPLETFDAVSSGAIQAGWDWMGYWSKVVPVAQFYGGMPFGPSEQVSASWMFSGGGLELINREYAKHGVYTLPCFIEPSETAGWYKEPVTGVDSYDGMKIRISGLGAKVLKKLGASTQLIPGGETYLALERGRVDAADYGIPTIDQAMGFYKIAPYNYYPGWHQSASWFSFIINKDMWDGFSADRKEQFKIACAATLQYSMNRLPAEQAEILEQLEKKGTKIKQLPEEVLVRVRKAWDEVLKEERKKPVVREMLESIAKHEAKMNKWYNLQDVSKYK